MNDDENDIAIDGDDIRMENQELDGALCENVPETLVMDFSDLAEPSVIVLRQTESLSATVDERDIITPMSLNYVRMQLNGPRDAVVQHN